MKVCRLSTGYMDRTLDERRARAFEAHLADCRECREKTNEWRRFEEALNAVAADHPFRKTTTADAEHLMIRAQNPKNEILRPLIVVTAPLAAAACLLLLAFWTRDAWMPDDGTDNVPVPRVEITSMAKTRMLPPAQLSTPLSAPKDGHLLARIDLDRVGLAPGGQMRILKAEADKVRVRLTHGTVACQIAKRRGSGRFVVEANQYTVTVLGTRFQVTTSPKRPLDVVVDSGTVKVTHKDGISWILRAGDVLSVGEDRQVVPSRAAETDLASLDRWLAPPASPSRAPAPAGAPEPMETVSKPSVTPKPTIAPKPAVAPTPPEAAPVRVAKTTAGAGQASRSLPLKAASPRPVPRARIMPHAAPTAPKKDTSADTTTWRQWILDGKTNDAKQAMEAHLKTSPGDGKTWALLADCERKERNWYAAVTAYEKVTQHGSAKQASHAMYMAATIYQDRLSNHGRALELFREYRGSGFVRGELKDLTDVKMARSLIAVGKCPEAVRVLETVIDNQGDSFVAANAKKLIKKCDPAR